jgi:hypothetical protein
MSDRHEKWVRVEPGTVIPAGQPYRVEWVGPNGPGAQEMVNGEQFNIPNNDSEWFIDSSWKPPLVLPTEPTWGIVFEQFVTEPRLGKWCLYSKRFVSTQRVDIGVNHVDDFIPLTDEQVARIEAAR